MSWGPITSKPPRTPTARKEYVCDWCGEKIEAGEQYVTWPWKDGEAVYSVKVHQECNDAIDREYRGMTAEETQQWRGTHEACVRCGNEFAISVYVTIYGAMPPCRPELCPYCMTQVNCTTCRFYALKADGPPTPWWCARHGCWQDGDPHQAACDEWARSARS